MVSKVTTHLRVPPRGVSDRRHDPRKGPSPAPDRRALILFFIYLSTLANAYALTVSLSGGPNCALDGNTLLYVSVPSVALTLSLDANEAATVYVNGEPRLTVTEPGERTLEVPTSPFTLSVDSNSTPEVDYNFHLSPLRLSVQEILVSVQTSQPSERAPVEMKVTVVNDDSPDEGILRVRVLRDSEEVISREYEVYVDPGMTVSRYLSFTPPSAGVYTVEATLEERGLTVASARRDVSVSVSRPDVSLHLPKTETTLPDDVAAQVTLRNGPVEREYTVQLTVYSPDGSAVFSRKKDIALAPDSVRTVVFPVSLGEDYPPGPYTFVATVSFQVGDREYTVDVQRTIQAAADVPGVSLELRVPNRAEPDREIVYVLEVRHQSTRGYDYLYQCSVYDPDGVLVRSDPVSPATLNLEPKETVTKRLGFTVPPVWKPGKYSVECRVWRRDRVWSDRGEFTLEVPSDLHSLILIPSYRERRVEARVCMSTRASVPVEGRLTVLFLAEGGAIYTDGPRSVKLTNSVECQEVSFTLPDFVSPGEVTVRAILEVGGVELRREAQLSRRRSPGTLSCDRYLVVPTDPRVTCTLVTGREGRALVGIVPRGSEFPRVFDERLREAMRGGKVVDVNSTLVVTLPVPLDLEMQRVVVIFQDRDGWTDVYTRDLTVIPAAASIKSVSTVSGKYYDGDRRKPLLERDLEFYQDVTVCSSAHEPVEVKIKADPPSDLVAVALENIHRVTLAPGECTTKTFVFRGGKYLPAAPVKVTYSLYLVRGDEEYLIGSKTVEGPAPAEYWKSRERRPRVHLSRYLPVALVVFVALVALWIYLRRRRRVEEANVHVARPPVQGQEGTR